MRTHLVSLACALALVGCSKDKKDGAANASGSAGSAGASGGSAASAGSAGSTAPSTGGDPAGMKVLDQGAEPRQLLLYKIPPSSKQGFTTTMDMTMDMGAQMGGKMKLPSMQMDGDVAFGDKDASGAIAFTLTTSKLEFVDTPDARVPASMLNDKLKGVALVASGTLAPNGHLADFKMEAKNAPAEMQQMLSGAKNTYDQMVTQLPAVPVGKGARWQVVQKIDQSGIKAEQTAVFEIVDISGDQVKLKSTVALSAPPQKISQGGATADLKKMAGTGAADLTLDLTKMIGPTDLTIHIDQEMAVMGQSISMAIDLVTKMQPK